VAHVELRDPTGSAGAPTTGWFTIFVNWERCCDGVDCDDTNRIGRSRNPIGPYLDQDSVDLADGGGTVVLDAADEVLGHDRYVSPGHAGVDRRGLALGAPMTRPERPCHSDRVVLRGCWVSPPRWSANATVVITLSIRAHVFEQDDQAAAELTARAIFGR